MILTFFTVLCLQSLTVIVTMFGLISFREFVRRDDFKLTKSVVFNNILYVRLKCIFFIPICLSIKLMPAICEAKCNVLDPPSFSCMRVILSAIVGKPFSQVKRVKWAVLSNSLYLAPTILGKWPFRRVEIGRKWMWKCVPYITEEDVQPLACPSHATHSLYNT